MDSLESQPQITPDGLALVYLGEKHLVAFETHPLRLLWQTDISNPRSFFKKVDQFQISPDGKLIYGIEGDMMTELFAYDVVTGQEQNLGPVQSSGRFHGLVGVLPTPDGTNKVIVEPYSF